MSQIQTVLFESDTSQILIDGKFTKIDPIISRLLMFLYEHKGQLVSREDLSQNVWNNKFTSDDAINRGLSNLRKALSDTGHHFIKTLPKKGYIFEVPPLIRFELNSGLNLKQTIDVNDRLVKTTRHRFKTMYKLLNINSVIIWSVSFVIFLVVLAFQNWWPLVTHHNAQNKVVHLHFGHWQSVNQNIYSHDQLGFLKSEVINQMVLDSRFKIYNGASVSSSNGVDLTVQQVGGQLVASLVLSTGDKQYTYRINSQNLEQRQLNNYLRAQVTAIIRLKLLYGNIPTQYMLAKESLTFADIEKLVITKKIITTNMLGGVEHGQVLLNNLSGRYQNNPFVMGLQAMYYKKVDHATIQAEFKSAGEAFDLSTRVLELDPSNLDALIVLFHHYYNRSVYKETARQLAKTLIYYHPNTPQAWRTKLFMLIKDATKCSDIDSFINTIPQGVFSQNRLLVIKQLLTQCMNPVSSAINFEQSVKSGSKTWINNLYLFETRHDFIFELMRTKAYLYHSKRSLVDAYRFSLMKGDTIKSQSLAHVIKSTVKGYDYWLFELYRGFYTQQDEIVTVKLADNFDLIDRYAGVYFALYLIKQARATKNFQALEHYINRKPYSMVSVANRLETIASIISLYASGKKSQSALMAKKLFHHLEEYRQHYRNSYDYYGLGKFQLMAGFYCQQQCDSFVTSNVAFLGQLFPDNYIWWLDDYHLMTEALHPWVDSSLASAYLELIERDRQRALGKNEL